MIVIWNPGFILIDRAYYLTKNEEVFD